jgi:uncharacterized protein (DUF2141 family)
MEKQRLSRLIISAMVFIYMLVPIFASVFGQETYSVAGVIHLLESEGQLFVQLKTFKEFDDDTNVTDPKRNLTIVPTQQRFQDKKVPFKFTGIPKGEYCIRCLHDVNSNNEMDRVPNVGIPAEPITYSMEPMAWKPMWEGTKFKVDGDVSGLEIKFP